MSLKFNYRPGSKTKKGKVNVLRFISKDHTYYHFHFDNYGKKRPIEIIETLFVMYGKHPELLTFLSKNLKGVPKIMDKETTIQMCRERHPEAENDSVAVDLTAQELYKNIQQSFQSGLSADDQIEDIQLYGYLNVLRKDLLAEAINNDSQIIKKEHADETTRSSAS